MNEKLEKFLEEQEYIEKKKYENEKERVLIELGLSEKEYAPLIGYGQRGNSVFKFSVNENAKVGDVMKVSKNGEVVDVIINRIKSEYSDEFPFTEWDSFNSINKYYKKVPIEITDEEYRKIKKYSKEEDTEEYIAEKNPIAVALTIIAWVLFIGGFIAGIALGRKEVTGGYYYTYTVTEFSFAIAFVYWCTALISGTIFLGFAEIIKILDAIKNK